MKTKAPKKRPPIPTPHGFYLLEYCDGECGNLIGITPHADVAHEWVTSHVCKRRKEYLKYHGAGDVTESLMDMGAYHARWVTPGVMIRDYKAVLFWTPRGKEKR